MKIRFPLTYVLCGLFLMTFWLLPAYHLQAQGLTITEFMANSDGGCLDEDGWDSDWIEIYNAGSEEVNLKGWGLSDNSKNLFKWVFPKRSIASGGRIVIFASGHDRKPEYGELHTNFKISSEEGGYLALTNPQGVIVSQYVSY